MESHYKTIDQLFLTNLGQHPNKIKVVLLGASATGKTALIQKVVSDQFPNEYNRTVGIDFMSLTLNWNDLKIRIQFWDTSGEERFHSLIPSYTKDSHLLIFVYDVSNLPSFEAIRKQLYRDLIQSEKGAARMMLLGNKIDKERAVSQEEAREFALKNGMEWHEVSAKTGAAELKQALYDFAGRKIICDIKLPLKEMYLSFLLQLFSDFDDDLLQDAVEELTVEQ